MAGSYGHITNDDGELKSALEVADMLENGGDVYEAVEQMYGMIWYLAHGIYLATHGHMTSETLVSEAEAYYKSGIMLSPGTN